MNYLTVAFTRIPVAFNIPQHLKLATGSHNCIPLTHSFTHSSTHSFVHSITCSLTLSLAHSFTYSLPHSFTLLLPHSLICALPTVTCSTILLNAITHMQTVTNEIFVAPYIGMNADTVIAVKVRSWNRAPTVCNLLSTNSSAGIGVPRNGLKFILGFLHW